MSFSSNGTSSLCNEVEGEVLGSSPIGCVCNLPIKKKKKKKSDGEIERIYKAYNVLINFCFVVVSKFFFFKTVESKYFYAGSWLDEKIYKMK